MDLDSYKKQVESLLLERHGQKEATRWMKTYEKDFQEFLDNGFNPGTAVAAMYAGY